jgi:cytochrome P450
MPTLSCILQMNIPHNRIAASDTTSVSLTFLLYYLLANRQHWDRLANEVRSSYASSPDICDSSLLKLSFLDAVIHESWSRSNNLIVVLRLRPPVPSNLQREVPEGGMMVAGLYFPAGVCLPSNPTHHRLPLALPLTR